MLLTGNIVPGMDLYSFKESLGHVAFLPHCTFSTRLPLPLSSVLLFVCLGRM